QGYRLRLRVDGAAQSFERELSAGTCEVLVESAVFLVELAGSQLTAADASTQSEAERARSLSERDPARGQSLDERDSARTRKGASARPTSERAAARGQASDERESARTRENGANARPSDEREAAREQSADALEIARGEAPAREPELISTDLPETTHRAPVDSHPAADGGDDVLAQTFSLRLGFGAAMIEAGLSGVSPHFALDLSLALAEWSIGLRVGALLHPLLRVAEGAEVDLQTNTAQLIGCRDWEVARVLIGPCMVLSALRTSADSTGLTGQRTSSASWLAAGPALHVQLRVVRSVLLGVELGAWATLTPRPSFEVAGNTLARAGTLAGYARVGAAYELW
ncbi:MAG TPA: hypothetical protein VMF89_01075, partial [Polyangiales bacterium]|nr:hypothetical protein [Polyangiales bacterium]